MYVVEVVCFEIVGGVFGIVMYCIVYLQYVVIIMFDCVQQWWQFFGDLCCVYLMDEVQVVWFVMWVEYIDQVQQLVWCY